MRGEKQTGLRQKVHIIDVKHSPDEQPYPYHSSSRRFLTAIPCFEFYTLIEDSPRFCSERNTASQDCRVFNAL